MRKEFAESWALIYSYFQTVLSLTGLAMIYIGDVERCILCVVLSISVGMSRRELERKAKESAARATVEALD